MTHNIKCFFKPIIGLTICISLVGCATKAKDARDPFEPMNRGIYQFNKAADNLFIKPVTYTYRFITPPPSRKNVNNFVQNVNEVPNTINSVLQGQPKQAGKAIFRFVVNSTLGILGIFDVATEMGVPRHKTTLSDTLVKWGYRDSAYIMLPLLGPSTVRDTIGFVGNSFMKPTRYLDDKYRYSFLAMTLINQRSELLEIEDVIDSAGVDEYAFVRNAYLQRRGALFKKEGEISEEDMTYLGEPPE